MSLKPLKKTDSDKEWLSGRRDARRAISPEYHLIVTEGTKTEPQYFGEIKMHINTRFRERIQLEVYGEGKNTVSLFEAAKQIVEKSPNGYKHIWIVYDTDDFSAESIDAVQVLCKENSNKGRRYHAIWSNQCIELWYLLYFSFFQSDINRRDYNPKLNECLKGISAGEYKKNRIDMFSVLRPYMETAISNAKKLNSINEGRTPSKSAPGTKVYELIEAIKPYI